MATLKRRLLRAGGWRIAKRIIKPIPVVGSLVAVSLAGYEIKKKGLLRGRFLMKSIARSVITSVT